MRWNKTRSIEMLFLLCSIWICSSYCWFPLIWDRKSFWQLMYEIFFNTIWSSVIVTEPHLRMAGVVWSGLEFSALVSSSNISCEEIIENQIKVKLGYLKNIKLLSWGLMSNLLGETERRNELQSAWIQASFLYFPSPCYTNRNLFTFLT